MTRRKKPVTFQAGVKLYDEGATNRVVWTDPETGRRRSARRQDRDLAEQVAIDVVRQLHQPRPGADNRDRPVDELVDWYLDSASHTTTWSASYTRSRTSICRNWLRPRLGALRCRDLEAHHVRSLIAAARDAGLQQSTLKSFAATCTGLVAAGHSGGFIEADRNPAAGAFVSEGATTAGQAGDFVDRSLIPPLDEVERLAVYMGRRWGDRWALQVRLAAFSGLRAGEMFALRSDAVAVDSCALDVRHARCSATGDLIKPKHGKVRTTIFPASLRQAMSQRCDEAGQGGLMFPRAGGTMNSSSSLHSTRLGPARRALGWPPHPEVASRWLWSWHSLRHVFCTWALAPQPDGLGLEVADVSYFAGHHSPDFTWRCYVSRREGAVERARLASEALVR